MSTPTCERKARFGAMVDLPRPSGAPAQRKFLPFRGLLRILDGQGTQQPDARFQVPRLERVDPNIPTDLGWDTVQTIELKIRGTGRTAAEAAWVGELESPVDIPLQRPGEQLDWRVSIEEWEILEGDPAIGPIGTKAPPLSKMRRLVYLEQMAL